MSAKYKIEFIERKTTSTGKEMAKLNLVSEEGELIQGVTIWSDFPNFKDFKLNDYIEGDYKDTGQWKNLYPPKPAPKAGGGFKSAQVEKLMDKKDESISKHTDRKEEGIMVSSTMRDSMQLALAEIAGTPFPTDEEVEAIFVKWRAWYLQKWSETKKLADQPF